MTHLDSQLDTVVVAYDIDGALTKKEVRERLRDDAQTRKVIPGIVSARGRGGIRQFMLENPDMEESVEFVKPSNVKITTLRDVKADYPGADRYIYRGSWFRDRLAANLAGWEYEQV